MSGRLGLRKKKREKTGENHDRGGMGMGKWMGDLGGR